MGSRDHPPLSKDPLPASWDSDWLAGWPIYHWEAGQEQAKANNSRDSREAGKRPQGCEICGVLSPHAGNWYIEMINIHRHCLGTHHLHVNGHRNKKKEERGTCPYPYLPCAPYLLSFASIVWFWWLVFFVVDHEMFFLYALLKNIVGPGYSI